MKKKILLPILVIIAVILADQFSKGVLLWLITGGVPLVGQAWEIVPNPYLMAHVWDFFNIVFTWNPGTSFSMFRALGEHAPIVIIGLTGFIIGFLGHYLFVRAPQQERVPLALVVGGAIGNLIDRVRFGAVIDFLDFHIGTWRYPSFNIADICICVGIGLFILNWYLARRALKKSVKGGK